MSQRTIPKSDASFQDAQQVITTKAIDNTSVWGLDNDWITTVLTPAKSKWESCWTACQNPSTRTPLMVFEKNEARRVYEPLIRLLVGSLEHNTKVNNNDLREMGIVVRSASRAAVPVPATYPVFSVDTGTIRRLSVVYRDLNSDKKSKPDGVSGAFIRWAMLNTAPTGVNELTNSAFNTTSPFTLDFLETDRGRRMYFCLAWQNTRGEKGPWSEIGMAIVP